MAKPEKYYGVTAVEVGNIVLRKLLEAAAANAPFELIEETIHTALEAPAYMRRGNVLSGFKVFGKQAVCDFFKEFVKRGIDDARYYELIYTLLRVGSMDLMKKYWLKCLRGCRSNLKVIPFKKITRIWIAGFAIPF